jgi:hypothetical protein
MTPAQLAAIAAYERRLQRPMTAIETACIAEQQAVRDKHAVRHAACLADRNSDIARRDTPWRRWLADRVELGEVR